LRLIDSRITQPKAQGPSRTCTTRVKKKKSAVWRYSSTRCSRPTTKTTKTELASILIHLGRPAGCPLASWTPPPRPATPLHAPSSARRAFHCSDGMEPRCCFRVKRASCGAGWVEGGCWPGGRAERYSSTRCPRPTTKTTRTEPLEGRLKQTGGLGSQLLIADLCSRPTGVPRS